MCVYFVFFCTCSSCFLSSASTGCFVALVCFVLVIVVGDDDDDGHQFVGIAKCVSKHFRESRGFTDSGRFWKVVILQGKLSIGSKRSIFLDVSGEARTFRNLKAFALDPFGV